MIIGLTLFSRTLGLPEASMTWKVTFLALLALGAYLALAGPGRLLKEEQARGGQIAVGLFALMSALGAAAIMAASQMVGAHWFTGDNLATPAAPLAASLVALLGAQAVIRGSQKLVPGPYNIGFIASWPTFILGTFDALTLGYLLLGRAPHAGWSADRQGALLLATSTAVATGIMLLGWVVYVARRRELWPSVSRACFVALVAASQEAVLIIVHGAGRVAHQAAGLDLLAAGVVMGVVAFFVTMLAEDTASAAERPTYTATGTVMRPVPVVAFEPREVVPLPERVPAREEIAA